MDDKVAADRAAKGEDNGRSILTEDQVLEIRERYFPGVVTLQTLGDEYGVCISVIHNAIHYKTWRHIG